MNEKIFGIDPGSHHLGVACIQKRGNTFELLFAAVLNAPSKETLYPRLSVLSVEVEKALDLWTPHVVAVEDAFFAKNARSAFQLGIARGVAIGSCLRRGLSVFEYTPTQVKSVVTGYGRADKAQVKKMVELTLGRKLDLGFDATDAIAIALCHASQTKFEQHLVSAKSLRP